MLRPSAPARSPFARRFRSRFGPSLLLACAGLVVAFALALPATADWPRWRGPSFDGTASPDVALPAEADVAFDLLWRRPLGSGYSSFSLADGKAVTQASRDGADWVVALDPETGTDLWSFRLADLFVGRSGSDDGSSSTPAIDGGRVYALHPGGRLVGLDLATGRLLWERHLQTDFGTPEIVYGYSSAPIAVGGRVFLQAGGPDGKMLVALDAADGQTVWTAGDGGVEHQNPTWASFAGVDQIIAVGTTGLSAFAAADGRPLWQVELEGSSLESQPVPLGGDRLLLARQRGCHLYRITRAEDGAWKARELWQSDAFGRTYAVPVRSGDHLYGFVRSFLSAVAIDSGEVVWKSRPPGGQALIRVGGQLLLLGADGALTAVAATPDGYRPSGRLELFDRRRVFTPPAYSDGVLYLRNLEEAAAVRVSAGSAAAGAPLTAAAAADRGYGSGELGRLLARLETATDKAVVVAEIESRFPSWPVVEEGPHGATVHFLFRGDVPDLALVGDMTGGYREDPLRRVAGTDLFHRSYDAPQGERWLYRFKVFEEARLDPANPAVVEGAGGERSVVVLPGWREPELEELPAAAPRGRFEQVELPRHSAERTYLAEVYLPPAYDADPQAELPLLMIADGPGARRFGEIDEVLERLIGRRTAPVVVALLEVPEALWWGQNRERAIDVLSEAVVEPLAERFRIADGPENRIFVAQEWAAGTALAWTLGAEIGGLVLQSPHFELAFAERTVAPLAAAAAPRRVWIDWGAFDASNEAWGLDVAADARRLAEVLAARGHAVIAEQTPGGADWTRWRARLIELLPEIYPPEE